MIWPGQSIGRKDRLWNDKMLFRSAAVKFINRCSSRRQPFDVWIISWRIIVCYQGLQPVMRPRSYLGNSSIRTYKKRSCTLAVSSSWRSSWGDHFHEHVSVIVIAPFVKTITVQLVHVSHGSPIGCAPAHRTYLFGRHSWIRGRFQARVYCVDSRARPGSMAKIEGIHE